MAERNFRQMLEAKWAEEKFVCVGLDSKYEEIPECVLRKDGVAATIVQFNRTIVEATKDIVCAYKPNSAFYEAQGLEGLAALHRTISVIRDLAPDVPVIVDAKRGDIGSTNAGYTQGAFDFLKADAITVSPYLGAEALQPFLQQADKGIIVLCRTSNPGGGEFQDLMVKSPFAKLESPEEIPLYQYVAHRVANHWNGNNNCALVVGATYPDELREVRGIVGDMPILIPGVGFQQKGVPLEKQVRQVVSAAADSRGRGMIINSARGIIFASKKSDFAAAARRETLKLHELINRYL